MARRPGWKRALFIVATAATAIVIVLASTAAILMAPHVASTRRVLAALDAPELDRDELGASVAAVGDSAVAWWVLARSARDRSDTVVLPDYRAVVAVRGASRLAVRKSGAVFDARADDPKRDPSAPFPATPTDDVSVHREGADLVFTSGAETVTADAARWLEMVEVIDELRGLIRDQGHICHEAAENVE